MVDTSEDVDTKRDEHPTPVAKWLDVLQSSRTEMLERSDLFIYLATYGWNSDLIFHKSPTLNVSTVKPSVYTVYTF